MLDFRRYYNSQPDMGCIIVIFSSENFKTRNTNLIFGLQWVSIMNYRSICFSSSRFKSLWTRFVLSHLHSRVMFLIYLNLVDYLSYFISLFITVVSSDMSGFIISLNSEIQEESTVAILDLS